MRNRLDQQLAQLNRELIEMGALCEEVIAMACRAVLEGDVPMAKKVAPLDSEIDQKERDIESLCLKLLLQFYETFLFLRFHTYFDVGLCSHL